MVRWAASRVGNSGEAPDERCRAGLRTITVFVRVVGDYGAHRAHRRRRRVGALRTGGCERSTPSASPRLSLRSSIFSEAGSVDVVRPADSSEATSTRGTRHALRCR